MKNISAVLFVLAAFAFSCSSNDGQSDGDNYSREALLANWADNIIIPSYVNYQSKVNDLSAKTSAFNSSPSTDNLSALRDSWMEAYIAYQYVAPFKMGKAEEIYFRESTNTYPTDVAGIQSNIALGTYDLAAISQFSKQGLPALDYLLNGIAANEAQIVEAYTTGPDAQNNRDYLAAVTARMKSNIDQVVAHWNGGYRDTFVASTGNSVNSSVNRMTNNFVQYVEKDIRTAKIGIPAGVFSNGVKFAEKTEAFYKNDISKLLLTTAVTAAKDFFNGKHFNASTSGEGLKSYLDYVNAMRDGQNLSDIINAQFAAIASVNNSLNTSLAQQVENDNSLMLAAYDALQQNVIYLKLDMMQALNITIDYVDSDGD